MLKSLLKLLLQLILIALFILLLIEHKLALYGIQQGSGQLQLIWNAKPIDNVLKDVNFSESFKQKLILIKEIKQYTIDSLGMNPTENYCSVFDQKNKSLLLNISACKPFAFEPKEWTFPFLGTVPYKGFFDKKEAEKEILNLKMQDYDIDAYYPSGWSTLGWFNDPILSNMLKRNEGSLSNLIIHELTHGTLFVKNNVNFNENLANFIADKGAEQFLLQKFGSNSKQYREYKHEKSDEKIYDAYILKSAERLDSLYKKMLDNEDDKIKKEKKNQLIQEIVQGVYDLPLFKKKDYFNYSKQAFFEGNAFFMTFTRYDSQYDLFNKDFTEHYKSNLKKYLFVLKEKFPSI